MWLTLDRIAEAVARAAVWAGGAMLLFAAGLVTVDVLLRKFAGGSFTGSDEISSYLFAISTSWAFSYVLLHRGNVRIDAFYLLLPRWVCAVLDIVALLALGGFMALLTYRAGIMLQTSLAMDARSVTPLRTRLAIPQALWVIGLVAFLLVLAMILVRAVIALARGDLATVTRLAGVPSVDEEIEEELHLGDDGRRGGA